MTLAPSTPQTSIPERLQRILEMPIVTRALALLILVSVAGLVLQTVAGLPSVIQDGMAVLETATIAAFSVEYFCRVWAAGARPEYRGIAGRIRFIVTPMALLDLAAVLPAYIPPLTADLRFLRVPRLLRLLRLAKLTRYSPALSLIGRVVYRKRVELFVVGTLAALIVIVAGSLMYAIESSAQPSEFASIPAAMWWAVVTLTTVGYGDVYPITGLGRFVASFITVLGVGLIALPTAILGSEFLKEVSTRRERQCPHCGESIGGVLDADE